MGYRKFVLAAAATVLVGCAVAHPSPAADSVTRVPAQRADGQAYELLGTQVFDVPDPASGIAYQVFVSLPQSYGSDPSRSYPVVYVTDADYGFPMLRLIARRMNGAGPRVEDFILVGLSYEKGKDPMASRRRDYTPTPNGASDAPPDAVHGQSLRYRDYMRETVFPFVAQRWRTQPDRRFLVGHSYGGLLGAQILLTEPDMFAGYVLGSPSFWYDKRYFLRAMPTLLEQRASLDARVYLYVGEFEAQRVGDRRYQQEVDMVEDNRAFERLLSARDYSGLQMETAVLPDEDHLSVAPRGFTRGLLYLLPANPKP
jgi:uncharacterized protein